MLVLSLVKYILGFIIGLIAGFVFTFAILLLLDKLEDTSFDLKDYLLGGDRSGYFGLALLLSFWSMLFGGFIGLLGVYYMQSRGFI